jgi:hypothetical protein
MTACLHLIDLVLLYFQAESCIFWRRAFSGTNIYRFDPEISDGFKRLICLSLLRFLDFFYSCFDRDSTINSALLRVVLLLLLLHTDGVRHFRSILSWRERKGRPIMSFWRCTSNDCFSAGLGFRDILNSAVICNNYS